MSYRNARKWMPPEPSDGKPILFQVMAWCLTAWQIKNSIYQTNFAPDPCRHMVSLGANELQISRYWWGWQIDVCWPLPHPILIMITGALLQFYKTVHEGIKSILLIRIHFRCQVLTNDASIPPFSIASSGKMYSGAYFFRSWSSLLLLGSLKGACHDNVITWKRLPHHWSEIWDAMTLMLRHCNILLES